MSGPEALLGIMVGELAERMDFAERMVAKQREPGKLAPPGL